VLQIPLPLVATPNRPSALASPDRLCPSINPAYASSYAYLSSGELSRLGLCGQRLPELNLIPIQVIDPGKATVGFIHSFGVNFYSLLF